MDLEKENIHSKLRSLKTQLFNVSKRSNLLYPDHQTGIYSLKELTNPHYFKNARHFIQTLTNSSYIRLSTSPSSEVEYRLNKLRSNSNLELKEFGQHSLKIAVFSLRWCEEEKGELVWTNSPLYFLKIKLIKEDTFQVNALDSFLEVNPALESILFQKQHIKVPKTISWKDQEYDEIIQNIQNRFLKNSQLDLVYNKTSSFIETKDQWTLLDQDLLIGNFNYRNVNIVNDFNSIISESNLPPLLRTFLNHKPSPDSHENGGTKTLEEYKTISSLDPSQAEVILKAMKGESFVVEGPPGTGKSQTISNLIATCLAEEKTVLFISSKKNALETVFGKISHHKLDHLCAIIHESQNNNKTFVQNLKSSYKRQNESHYNLDRIEGERLRKVEAIRKHNRFISRYQSQMLHELDSPSKTTLKLVVDQLCAYRAKMYKAPLINEHELPEFSLFLKHRKNLKKISKQCKDEKDKHIPFSQHPASFLRPENYTTHKDSKSLRNTLNRELTILSNIQNLIEKLNFQSSQMDIETLKEFKNKLQPYNYFWTNNIHQILDNTNHEYQSLSNQASDIFKLREKSHRLQKINQYWKKKFSPTETQHYIEIAKKYENKFAPFFYKEYRHLKREINRRFEHHFLAIKHSDLELLNLLKQEHDTQEKLLLKEQIVHRNYGEKDVLEIFKLARTWHDEIAAKSKQILTSIMQSEIGENERSMLFEKLGELNTIEHALIDEKTSSLSTSISSLKMVLASFHFIEDNFEEIKLFAQDSEAYDYFRNTSYHYDEIEYHLFNFTYNKYSKTSTDFLQFSAHTMSEHISQLQQNRFALNELNIASIRAAYSDALKRKIRFSQLSKKGLSDQENVEQESLKKGLRYVEKEFDKSRAFSSIRSLNEGDTKSIISLLKPVWLMSPQSVANSLALTPELFDLVIFDEASQVGLEESIPSLYRAKQCVIFGDSMQLPPSEFFHKSIRQNDGIYSHKTSLLEESKNIMPSISLLWHYRSRNEALINFNNHAFYNQSLKTIPTPKTNIENHENVVIEQVTQAAFTYQEIREKPLSFHYVKNSVYSQGKNEKEALYIAELVKHFLLSQQSLNIGIVCPSLTQQNCIESALSKVSYFEKSFEELMNDKHESDESFDGLFIRNLENIQGEEKDIIIISLTYGPNENGEVKMSFGPIMNEGGEKRLNVLFSRAKKHQVIVSSLKHNDLLDSENKGAQILKKYLNYAEQVSLGNEDQSKKILDSFNRSIPKSSSWIQDLANEIRNRGYIVDLGVGNSSLKCSLAIKEKADDESYLLGILSDESSHFYEQTIEQSLIHPFDMLSSHSWNLHLLFAKDYLKNKQVVLDGIIHKIEQLQSGNVEEIELQETKQKEALINEEKLLFTRLEKSEKDHLFWELAGNLHDLIIRYGKVGSKGTRLIKNYSTVAEVIKEKRKLIRQKEKSGYRRV